MLSLGLVAEVAALRGMVGDRRAGVLRSVGYRQVSEYLDGRYGEDEMRARALAATRQLAKRQLTWLRRWPAVHRVAPGEDALSAILKLV